VSHDFERFDGYLKNTEKFMYFRCSHCGLVTYKWSNETTYIISVDGNPRSSNNVLPNYYRQPAEALSCKDFIIKDIIE